MSRLDRAIDGLHIDGLATLVMARIEQTEDDAAQGLRTLRWTNAGHPPPILLHADGTTDVLATVPEMLVGVMPGIERSDHTHVLPRGPPCCCTPTGSSSTPDATSTRASPTCAGC